MTQTPEQPAKTTEQLLEQFAITVLVVTGTLSKLDEPDTQFAEKNEYCMIVRMPEEEKENYPFEHVAGILYSEFIRLLTEKKLANLTYLILSDNQLTRLPPEIGQLQALTSLDLSDNQLASLPPEIGQLQALTLLNLSDNHLASLPPEIGQLQALTSLTLSGNQLASLPPEIGQLQALTLLNLSGNQLASLPPEIGQLQALTSLYLHNNQLASLPPEIGQPQALTSLYLSGNQLASLPPEIGQLQALTSLDLSYNQLASLPPEIGQLQALTLLILSGNQLASLPPEIGQLQSLTSLDLSNNQLTSLPPEIGQFQALTSLTLSRNQLTNLPTEIGQLQALTDLDLFNNQLASLPPEIENLHELTWLSLIDNQFASLPNELWNLSKLKHLHISYNQIENLPPELWRKTDWESLGLSKCNLTSLPPEIGKLKNITSLSLSSNQITSLPPEIGQLQALTKLDLFNNQFVSLPDELWNLPNLKQLDLSYNRIENLPPELWEKTDWESLGLGQCNLASLPTEIGQFRALTTLDLRFNQLANLPDELWNLPNLKQLYLSYNRIENLSPELWRKTDWEKLGLGQCNIASLPPEIGQLHTLTLLDLSGNQLASLPSEIRQLQSLTELDLSGNQFTNLLPEIAQLRTLTSLDLSYNKISNLPPELAALHNIGKISLRSNPLEIAIPAQWLENRERSWEGSPYAQDILAYYKQLHEEGGCPLGEARILVVGEADAGKTKLLRALLKGEHGARFIEIRDPTEGIEVNALEEEGLRLRFWDFGGQEILHATHRFFLSRRCVYLLVADSTRDREYNESKIEYWLELIKFYGGESPVLLVASKTENFSLNVNERRLQEKYPNLVRMPALQTSARTGRGIPDLRRALLEQAQSLPSVSVMLPRSFLAVKKAMEDLKAREKVKVIEEAVYRRLCQENGIPEEERQNTLLGLLHDMGVVLHYEDDRLSDFGILNPDWATGGVYKVVNNPLIKDAHGKFTLAQLKGLLDDEELYPAAMRRRIVDLMKKFELTYELPLAHDTYILPSALPVNQPELDGWDVPTMTFEYRYPVLQVSVLHRFIVITHESILDEQIWYSGVALAQGENQALVKADFRDRRITIKVKGAEETRKEFLYHLRTHFEHIHGEETQPEEYIYPTQYPDLPLPFADMKTLAKSEREYKAVYKGKTVSINLRELLDGFVTPEERRKDEEKEKQESERIGLNIELQERERAQRLQGGDTYVTNINVSGNVSGNIVAGNENQIRQSISNADLAPELKDALLQLADAVQTMLPALSTDAAKKAEKNLKKLVEEASEPEPDRQWYEVSIEGLIQAAKNLNELGTPVISLAGKVLKLLSGLS